MSKDENKAPGGQVITREQADKEIGRWLDNKRIRARKREDMQDNIEILIEGVQDGILVVNDDFVIVQKLDFPIESGDVPVKELKFKPRLALKEVHAKQRGVKANDIDGRLIGYVSALTEAPTGLIKNMDTADYTVSSAIAVFFL